MGFRQHVELDCDDGDDIDVRAEELVAKNEDEDKEEEMGEVTVEKLMMQMAKMIMMQ